MMKILSLIAVAALPTASAFVSPASSIVVSNKPAFVQSTPLFAEEGKTADSVFLAPEEGETDDDVAFAKAESLGRGSSKVS